MISIHRCSAHTHQLSFSLLAVRFCAFCSYMYFLFSSFSDHSCSFFLLSFSIHTFFFPFLCITLPFSSLFGIGGFSYLYPWVHCCFLHNCIIHNTTRSFFLVLFHCSHFSMEIHFLLLQLSAFPLGKIYAC